MTEIARSESPWGTNVLVEFENGIAWVTSKSGRKT